MMAPLTQVAQTAGRGRASVSQGATPARVMFRWCNIANAARRARLVGFAALCLASAACARDGVLEFRLVAAPGQDPFAGATTARLTLGTQPPLVREFPIGSDGTLDGSLKPAPTNVVVTVKVELLDSRGEVVARGASPEVPLAASINGYVELLVGRVGAFAALPTGLPTATRKPTLVTLSSSEVLVAGGSSAIGPIAQASVYNGYGFFFEPAGNLSTARAEGVALPGTGGKFYLHGGLVPNLPQPPAPTATVEVFDTGTRTFASGMGGGGGERRGATANAFPNSPDRWLIAGGAGIGDVPLETALLFDVTAASFTSSAPMNAARRGHTATAVNTAAGARLLMLGGNARLDGSSSGPDAELFEPTARVFMALPAALGARREHSATLLGDGRVLIAGGRDASGAPRDDVVLYQPQSPCDSASSCEAFVVPQGGGAGADPFVLGAARAGHAAYALDGNRVLLVGGRDRSGGVHTAAEVLIYDPVTRRLARESTPALNVPRADFGSVVLSTGQVLLAGGVDSSGTPLATVEMFVPR